jgi:glutamate synthase (NADPH) small chain
MADPRGFLKVPRKKAAERPAAERVHDWRELTVDPTAEALTAQASRCMDCGIPFCHRGCPLGNVIPEFNDLVYRGHLDESAEVLLSTNNFPELTGRVCPAPCEASCVLELEGAAVTIKDIERRIAQHVLASPLAPLPPLRESGKRVAVIGSGPAGLAAAQELRRAGHAVTVFERDDRLGGLLRYGIPDFKMEKGLIDRRVAQLEAEGVVFRTGVAGEDAPLGDFDATVLAVGARVARPLAVPGANLGGVHYAMDYLTEQNRRVAGDTLPPGIDAKGKRVVVIGGGDTGADCVGTAIRQGASEVLQWELMPKPPLHRAPENPWPEWPLVLRTGSSHEEGCERTWAIQTVALAPRADDASRVGSIEAVRVELAAGRIVPASGAPATFPCDLVLLAMGFTSAEPGPLLEKLGLGLDGRGRVPVDTETMATEVPGVFSAGDASRGASLVVWAIADGRKAAASVNAYLAARTRLRSVG